MTKKVWGIPAVVNVLLGIILSYLFCLLLNVLMIETFREDVYFVNETVTIWFYAYAIMIIYILGYTIVNILLYHQYYKKLVTTPNHYDYIKITIPITVISSVFFGTLYILIKLL